MGDPELISQDPPGTTHSQGSSSSLTRDETRCGVTRPHEQRNLIKSNGIMESFTLLLGSLLSPVIYSARIVLGYLITIAPMRRDKGKMSEEAFKGNDMTCLTFLHVLLFHSLLDDYH